MKIKTNNNLILFFIGIQIFVFLLFSFVKTYNPSIDKTIIILLSNLIAMIYLFFSESKLRDFLEIYLTTVVFMNFSLRVSALTPNFVCIDKTIRLFYFLVLFSISLNFIKQKEKNIDENTNNVSSNSVFIQSIIFIIFLLFSFVSIDKIKLEIYTFLFFIIFFSFLLSVRKIILFLK